MQAGQVTAIPFRYRIPEKANSKIKHTGTLLVVQWLKICLVMWETPVGFLVGELESHMLRGSKTHEIPQFPSLCATTEAQRSQINK